MLSSQVINEPRPALKVPPCCQARKNASCRISSASGRSVTILNAKENTTPEYRSYKTSSARASPLRGATDQFGVAASMRLSGNLPRRRPAWPTLASTPVSTCIRSNRQDWISRACGETLPGLPARGASMPASVAGRGDAEQGVYCIAAQILCRLVDFYAARLLVWDGVGAQPG